MDKTIICSDNQGGVCFQIRRWNKNPKNRDQSALFIISRFLNRKVVYHLREANRSVHGLGFLMVHFRPRIVIPSLPEIFHCNDPKSRVSSLTLQPDFTETFCKW